VSEIVFFQAVNIWQKNSVRLANTLLKDGESARDSHVLACNFARYFTSLKHH